MSRIDEVLAEEGARAEVYSVGPAPEHVTTSRPNLRRQIVVSVRLAADEHERLSQAARQAGIPLSTLIRIWAVDRLHAEDKGEKFIRGNARLTKMFADPETCAEVDAIVDEMGQIDRAYKMGLAAVRHAANLTQTELAQRMGIKQAALSGVENREDLLLSTLASYLEAAGARDVAITAKLGDHTIEMPLPKVTGSDPASA